MDQARNMYPYWTEVNGPIPIEPGSRVLNVLPLNSVPPSHAVDISPPKRKADSDSPASATDINSGPPASAGLSTMASFTSHPTTEERGNVRTDTKIGVAMTGSAAKGKAGPEIGSVDIAGSEDEYLFRVALPGVVRDPYLFSCDVQADGGVTVRGKKSTGAKKVRKDSMVFKMQTESSPPGDFSVSFRLPGPIDHQHQIQGLFGTDGIFEAIVRKKAPENRAM